MYETVNVAKVGRNVPHNPPRQHEVKDNVHYDQHWVIKESAYHYIKRRYQDNYYHKHETKIQFIKMFHFRMYIAKNVVNKPQS